MKTGGQLEVHPGASDGHEAESPPVASDGRHLEGGMHLGTRMDARPSGAGSVATAETSAPGSVGGGGGGGGRGCGVPVGAPVRRPPLPPLPPSTLARPGPARAVPPTSPAHPAPGAPPLRVEERGSSAHGSGVPPMSQLRSARVSKALAPAVADIVGAAAGPLAPGRGPAPASGDALPLLVSPVSGPGAGVANGTRPSTGAPDSEAPSAPTT
jgi:hypothetical protein